MRISMQEKIQEKDVKDSLQELAPISEVGHYQRGHRNSYASERAIVTSQDEFGRVFHDEGVVR